jgi:hypothetical protein
VREGAPAGPSNIARCLKHGRKYNINKTLFSPEMNVVHAAYAEPALRAFEPCPTLIVHAAMKMGKTKALVDYLATHYGSTLVKPKIRFISFRQTFSANIKEKFPDFQLYSDTTGLIYAAKVIIQVESLHRLAIVAGDDAPDLLILDECESIFEQFDSGLLKHFNDCFAKFQYLLRYSKRVICMDANISQRTANILHSQRGGQLTYHHNTFKNATDDTYYLTEDKVKWLGLLFSTLETDRVAIPISSLADAKVLYGIIAERRPELRIRMYTSETPAKEKNEHFRDVDNYWALYDVLIYTPTVSAGVSFEVKHYSKIFGYFSDQSCPVETCSQMMGRIRDVADKSYFIYMGITYTNKPVTTADIRAQILARRESFHSSYDDMGLTAVYDATGQVKINESPYFQIYLENTRMKNISTVYFAKQMIYILGQYGANIEDITDDVFEQMCGHPLMTPTGLHDSIKEVYVDYKASVRMGKLNVIEDIFTARDLSEAEVAEIKFLEEVSAVDKKALERYYLRRHYGYQHGLTRKFIATYTGDRVKRNFKNIQRLQQDNALAAIKQVELTNFTTLYELGDEYQHRDLKYRYVYNQHRYALGLLKIFGWTGIEDDNYVAAADFNADVYLANIHAICAEFNQRQTSTVEKMETVIALSNSILLEMYGLKIIEAEKDVYRLRQSGKFTKDPACITKPCILI